MTFAELERWPIQAQWGEAKRNRLTEYLKRFAVMPWDRALFMAWAHAMATAQTEGIARTPELRRRRCCTAFHWSCIIWTITGVLKG
jgi:hypothetical protein